MGSNQASINIKHNHMTKETIKSEYLDVVAPKLKTEWHSQAAHKMAVGVWALDTLDVQDPKKRAEFLKAWHETPSSFGTNCSALGQSLGRVSTKAKIEETFSGF